MAWSAPRTWVTDEIVTAAVMNAHIRDNLNAIQDGDMTLDADWDIGDGRAIQCDKIAARDGDGLYLVDDADVGLFVKDGGMVLLNDTANTYSTLGLTLNQGANDNEILTLKSSDVGHGGNYVTEADTYALMKKISGAGGGLRLMGLEDGGGTDEVGLELIGVISQAVDTARSAAANGVVEIQAWYHAGGGTYQEPGGNGNVLAVRAYGSTKFIIDAEGDYQYDGADAGAYDDENDALACWDLSHILTDQWHKIIEYGGERLERMGVITITPNPNRPEGRDVFVSGKSLDRLLMGAVGQLYQRLENVAERLEIAEARLLTAGA